MPSGRHRHGSSCCKPQWRQLFSGIRSSSRDAPLGIVMQDLRERLGSEEIPWNDSLKTQEQSGSFAQDR
jgi:hypothetical protein